MRGDRPRRVDAVSAEEHEVRFGERLRSLRTAALLTQEGLAEAASVSSRTISDLERGVNLTARKETARLLADALKLSGTARAEFESAARGSQVNPANPQRARGADQPLVADTTPKLPDDLRLFAGRETDLAQLMDVVTGDGGVVGIYAIDGMAGVGKSAFAVHAAHLLAPRFPDGQIFLPLRAHAAGQQPVDPADALVAAQNPPGLPANRRAPAKIRIRRVRVLARGPRRDN